MACTCLTQPLQAGSGKECCVGFTRCQLCKARGDIAAEGHDLAVRPGVQELSGAARRAGSDHRAGRQRGNAFGADQHIAHVRAFEHGGDGEAVRAQGFHVLGRVDGEIDLARIEPGVEFLGPQRLAADFRQWSVLDAIAAGGDGHDLYMRRIDFMRPGQSVARFLRLRHGERRAAGAEAESLVLSMLRIHGRLVLPVNVVQGKPG